MIGLHELNNNKDRITSIIFKKDEYDMESIIRWIFDRGFSFDYFSEKGNYYFIIQSCKKNYSYFKYEKIKGYNIAVELGSEKPVEQDEIEELNSLIGI